MYLNIRKLMRGGEEPVSGTLDLDFTETDFGHVRVVAPTRFAYTAVPHKGMVRLELTLHTTLGADCARCLQPVVQSLAVEKTYEIRETDLSDEFPELPLTPAGLDLQELAYGEVLLEADPVPLCSEDCPGLCPRCGKRACGCEATPEGDPRWDVLRQLLD